MKPGPTLDASIAEKVMGWTRVKTEENDWFLPPEFSDGRAGLWKPTDRVTTLPRYSTRIAAAWMVVEKMAPLYGDGFFRIVYGDSADHRFGGRCTVGRSSAYDENDEDVTPWSAHFHLLSESDAFCCARGETAPHAICLAALKAMGVTLDE